MVNQLSVDDKQLKNRRNQSGEWSCSRKWWFHDKRDRGQQQDRGFSDWRRIPTPGPSNSDRLLEEMNRPEETAGRVSSAELEEKKDTS